MVVGGFAVQESKDNAQMIFVNLDSFLLGMWLNERV